MTRPIRVFIYGSCVSRDTFGRMESGRYKLMEYVARQSLISAYSPPSTLQPVTLDSSFQTRMVRYDISSALMSLIAAHASEIDILLWDLADERFGVDRLPDGSTATRSSDLLGPRGPQSGVESSEKRHLAFGSDEHFTEWKAAATQFSRDLEALRVKGKTVLLAPRWAAYRNDGSRTTPSFDLSTDHMNEQYSRYFSTALDLGFTLIHVPEAAVRSDPEHEWGDAPFHYTHDVYRSLITRIEQEIPPVPASAVTPHHGWDALVDPWVDSLPVKSDKLPSAYRIWQSSRRYLLAGDHERAQRCEQLNKLLHSSHIPAKLVMGEEVSFEFGGIGVAIHPDCEIGRGVTIGAGAIFGENSTPRRPGAIKNRTYRVPRVEDYAQICTGAKVLGGVTLGAFSITLPNSVVARDVLPGEVVAGAPATTISRVTGDNARRYHGNYPALRRASVDEFMATIDRYLTHAPRAETGTEQ